MENAIEPETIDTREHMMHICYCHTINWAIFFQMEVNALENQVKVYRYMKNILHRVIDVKSQKCYIDFL